jgi:hypothetical protein
MTQVQNGQGAEGNVYSDRCAWPQQAISHLKIPFITNLPLKQYEDVDVTKNCLLTRTYVISVKYLY